MKFLFVLSIVSFSLFAMRETENSRALKRKFDPAQMPEQLSWSQYVREVCDGDEYQIRKMLKHKPYFQAALDNISIDFNTGRPKPNANHSYASLREAVIAGDEYAVRKFLAQENININELDKNGDTPVHHAADYRDILILEILCFEGGNPNLKNKKGLTPYGIAKASTGTGEIDHVWSIMNKAYNKYYQFIAKLKKLNNELKNS
jgi:hypothetical protein